MNETESLLILNAVKGLGNAGIRKLLDRYGSATEVLSLREADLLENPIIPAKVIRNIFHFSKDKFLEAEYNLITKRQVNAVVWGDDDYPQALCEIADAPVVLYVKGDLPSSEPLSISIVGSRRASIYGVSISEKFAYNLAELGFIIVSGMARGIDTAAHNGALRAFGTTIAVLGCGLDQVYPLENRDLLEKISETGAIVSEFPMQMAPLPHNFPRRNRIISGLSLGVIIVEAAMRSGALITADFALEQGREVFAVPGKIDQTSSDGVNNLIKQGAKLITCVEDILEDIKPVISDCLKNEKHAMKDGALESRLKELTKEEKFIFDHITDRPVHIDELTNCCDTVVPVMSVLLQLELKRLVKQLPGKLFVNDVATYGMK